MRSRILIVGLALAAAAGRAVPARAEIGLGMRFGDVILENLTMGRPYDLREIAHVPFGVENRGDADAEVMVVFERPSKAGLAKDYEVVPDPAWFKVLPTRALIGAHGVGFFNLVLTIPDDPAYKGKNYQVTVKAVTIGQGLLNVAIENRIRFSVGPGPESIVAEKKKKAMQKLDFDVTPGELYVTGVSVGSAYDARQEAKKSIRIANYSSDPLEVTQTVEKWDRNLALPEGFEPIPDPGWIKMKFPIIKIGPEAIGMSSVIVEIPKDDRWKAKKFAAVIRTGLTTGFWLDAPVKLLVETKP